MIFFTKTPEKLIQERCFNFFKLGGVETLAAKLQRKNMIDKRPI